MQRSATVRSLRKDFEAIAARSASRGEARVHAARYVASLPLPIRQKFIRAAYRLTQAEIPKAAGKNDGVNAYAVGVAVLTRLFKDFPVDPDYRDYMQERAKVFVTALCRQKDITPRQWRSYSDRRRAQIMEEVSELRARIFSSPDFRFRASRFGGFRDDNKSHRIAEMRGGKLFVNRLKKFSKRLPEYIWGHFPSMVTYSSHEDMHYFHTQMVAAYQRGELSKKSVFYKQAKLFAGLQLGKDNPIYFHSEEHPGAYRQHPEERDARRIHPPDYAHQYSGDARKCHGN